MHDTDTCVNWLHSTSGCDWSSGTGDVKRSYRPEPKGRWSLASEPTTLASGGFRAKILLGEFRQVIIGYLAMFTAIPVREDLAPLGFDGVWSLNAADIREMLHGDLPLGIPRALLLDRMAEVAGPDFPASACWSANPHDFGNCVSASGKRCRRRPRPCGWKPSLPRPDENRRRPTGTSRSYAPQSGKGNRLMVETRFGITIRKDGLEFGAEPEDDCRSGPLRRRLRVRDSLDSGAMMATTVIRTEAPN